MSLDLKKLNRKLDLDHNGEVRWAEGTWHEGKLAGDAKGRVSISGIKYKLESVKSALIDQDLSHLRIQGHGLGKRTSDQIVHKKLRNLLTKTTKVNEIQAIATVLSILEVSNV